MTFAIILIALALMGMIALTLFCMAGVAHLDKRLRLTHELINERCGALEARVSKIENRPNIHHGHQTRTEKEYRHEKDHRRVD